MNEEAAATVVCDNCEHDIPVRNLVTHDIHCQRNNILCQKCMKRIRKTDVQNHNEKMHTIKTCCLCDEKMEKYLYPEHKLDKCPKRLVACKFCEIEIFQNKMAEHENYCGSRTEKCSDCGEYVMLKYRTLHLDSNHGFLKLEDEKNEVKKTTPSTSKYSNSYRSRNSSDDVKSALNSYSTPNATNRPTSFNNLGRNTHDSLKNIYQITSLNKRENGDRGTNSSSNLNHTSTENSLKNDFSGLSLNSRQNRYRDGASSSLFQDRSSQRNTQTSLDNRSSEALNPRLQLTLSRSKDNENLPRRVIPMPQKEDSNDDQDRFTLDLKKRLEINKLMRVPNPPPDSMLFETLGPAYKSDLNRVRNGNSSSSSLRRNPELNSLNEARGPTHPSPSLHSSREKFSSQPQPERRRHNIRKLDPKTNEEIKLPNSSFNEPKSKPSNSSLNRGIGGNSSSSNQDPSSRRNSEFMNSLNENRQSRTLIQDPTEFVYQVLERKAPMSPDSTHNRSQTSDSNTFELPCEFCSKLIPAEDLILHQTGCRPDLASYESPINLPCEFCLVEFPANTLLSHQSLCLINQGFD